MYQSNNGERFGRSSPSPIAGVRQMPGRAVVVLAVAVLSAGCSGAPDTSIDTDETAPNTVSLGVLHEFDVEGVRYRILDAGEPGAPSVILGQEAPVHAGAATPLARVLARHADLTNLEIYLALAPDGEAPAEQLVASHALETSLLGRDDLAVRKVALEPRGVVEKSLTTCQNIVRDFLELSWSGDITINDAMAAEPNDHGTIARAYAWFTAADAAGHPMAVALCNDSQSGTPINTKFRKKQNGIWVTVITGTLNPDAWHAYRWGTTAFAKNLYAVGTTPTGALAYQATGAYGFNQ